eukprot:CAMPEP_0113307262 /NCGR_PEP_ID=MMETSP0010_2-20120614/6178_1 /TAXON_ID=216773 ORGANISM="Corethron hystrix, Strain 308" /NCGR_SAMPLE_ID=MMETSP0010_2 /ASSEMBLY_ACC=CAM_ASM_000155 /LENGTH=341 /DNA_ID=CAMNT_0000162083 /DNA_START=306 /DNA_END=1328 /DNA_ORIENTATION=+ /assembly_acc=CAM_ASM_000155
MKKISTANKANKLFRGKGNGSNKRHKKRVSFSGKDADSYSACTSAGTTVTSFSTRSGSAHDLSTISSSSHYCSNSSLCSTTLSSDAVSYRLTGEDSLLSSSEKDKFFPSAVATHVVDGGGGVAIVACAVALPYFLCDFYAAYSCYGVLSPRVKDIACGSLFILLGGMLPVLLTVIENYEEVGGKELTNVALQLVRHGFYAVVEAQRSTEMEEEEAEGEDEVETGVKDVEGVEQDTIQRHAQILLSHCDLLEARLSLCDLQIAWSAATVVLAAKFPRPTALASVALQYFPSFIRLRPFIQFMALALGFSFQRISSAIEFAMGGGKLLTRAVGFKNISAQKEW